MGGEGASWLGALADRFPETPAPLLHLALHYYRNELDPGSDRAASLPWIPKLLPPRRPPLPVLARRPFEAHPSPRSLTDDDPVPLPPFLSSKCHTPYLQLLETLQDDLDADADVDVDALRGLLEAAMGALFARPTNRWVDLTPHRNRCSLADPPAGHAPAANSIAADDLPSLCDAVFEAYVETCDAAELCARMKDVCGDAGSSVRREELLEALEDYEMDVSARAARLQTTMDLVATVAVSVMSVMSVTSDPSSTDLTRALAQWSEGWHAVVDALRPVAAAYMTPALAALVVPVVCKSALDGLRSACATGSLLSLTLSSDLAARLGDVKQQLGLVLPEEQYRAEKIHGVHHNAGAVLSVMRFESRMEVFSKLVDCVRIVGRTRRGPAFMGPMPGLRVCGFARSDCHPFCSPRPPPPPPPPSPHRRQPCRYPTSRLSWTSFGTSSGRTLTLSASTTCSIPTRSTSSRGTSRRRTSVCTTRNSVPCGLSRRTSTDSPASSAACTSRRSWAARRP